MVLLPRKDPKLQVAHDMRAAVRLSMVPLPTRGLKLLLTHDMRAVNAVSYTHLTLPTILRV